MKSNIWFTVHVGNITELGSPRACGEGEGLFTSLRWMEQCGTGLSGCGVLGRGGDAY